MPSIDCRNCCKNKHEVRQMKKVLCTNCADQHPEDAWLCDECIQIPTYAQVIDKCMSCSAPHEVKRTVKRTIVFSEKFLSKIRRCGIFVAVVFLVLTFLAIGMNGYYFTRFISDMLNLSMMYVFIIHFIFILIFFGCDSQRNPPWLHRKELAAVIFVLQIPAFIGSFIYAKYIGIIAYTAVIVICSIERFYTNCIFSVKEDVFVEILMKEP